MRLRHLVALSIALATTISQANAAPINWTSWSGNSVGSILTTGGSVGVTYLGEMNGLTSNYPSWTPTTTWTDSSTVSNPPSQIGAMIRLNGGGGATAVTDTLTFSAPVLNPVMAIWSLGASGAQASFDFIGASPVLIAGGPSAEYGGSSIIVTGNSVFGSEGNGTVQFLGTFSSLSWKNPAAENFYGFTVGTAGLADVPPVPEPHTYVLLVGGLIGLTLLQRRRTV